MYKYSSVSFILLILLSGCSESENPSSNPSSFIDNPLNLTTGQCFNDFSNLDLEYEDGSVDAESVEVVSCNTPHNNEVLGVYSSVPLSYRNLTDPPNDLCVDETSNYISSLPKLKNVEFDIIAEVFDSNFMISFYTYRGEYGKIDLNNTIVCAVSSTYTLTKKNLSESLPELIL
tara:strand:+ start:324 stop:845 length:522 start_codon:yes stop_codon:yes gene_type:complete